jgi:hypothetical protein
VLSKNAGHFESGPWHPELFPELVLGRLRPNIVMGGVTGLEEREWEGGEIRIGDTDS